MNIKKLCRKEILQIMEKTMVDCISISSSIYHCNFFLHLPLVMSDGDLIWSQAACLSLPGIYYLWLTPSVVNLVRQHSAVKLRHHRAGQSPSWGQGYCFQSGCCHWEASGLPEQDGSCSMEDDSALGSWQFFPQCLHPQSLLRWLQSTLPYRPSARA